MSPLSWLLAEDLSSSQQQQQQQQQDGHTYASLHPDDEGQASASSSSWWLSSSWFLVPHDFASPQQAREFYVTNSVGMVVTLLCVAIVSGLFLGLLTMDEMDLQIVERSSLDVNERNYARSLLPIIRQRHYLLVTLLLANTIVYETLPLFMGEVFPDWLVVCLSTSLIMIFGEVLPSAVFTGPHQLALGYRMVPVVRVLGMLFYPIAKPMSLWLDRLVGNTTDGTNHTGGSSSHGHHPNHHYYHGVDPTQYHPPPHHYYGTTTTTEVVNTEEEAYNRGELAALVEIQYEQRTAPRRRRTSWRSSTTTKPSFWSQWWWNQRGSKTVREPSETTTTDVSVRGSNHQAPQSSHWQHSYQSMDDHGPTTMGHNAYSSSTTTATWSDMKQEMFEAVRERAMESTTHDSRSKQYREDILEAFKPPPMEKQEVDVVVGAMEMKTKVTTDVFTPLRLVYSIPDDLILDRSELAGLYAAGWSRIPVYRRLQQDQEDIHPGTVDHPTTGGNLTENDEDKEEEEDDWNDKCRLLGVLMTRNLMLIDWEHERPVKTLPLLRPPIVSPRRHLVSLLKLLRTGGSHMAFVCARPDLANRDLDRGLPLGPEAGFMGIITLEDIMESILQTRIYDELDVRIRDRAMTRLTQWAARTLQRVARQRAVQRRLSFNDENTATAPDAAATTTNNDNNNGNETSPLLGNEIV